MSTFNLFPLLPETKTPALAWDTFKTGARRSTPADVQAWRAAGNNLAVATGAVSGCIVLDCDSLAAWGEAIGRGVPDSYTVTTPRGFHLYYAHPGGHVGNRAKLGGVSGWDIRGDGGYVVAPGSHYTPSPEDAAKGKVPGNYAVEHDLPLAPAPQWLLDLLVKDAPHAPVVPHVECEQTTPYGRSALNGALAELTDAVVGENLSDTIYRTSARIAELVAGGEIRYDEGWESLEEAMRRHGVADEEKANGTLSRGWEKGWSNPKRATERTVLTADAAFGQRDTVTEDDVPLPPTPTFGVALNYYDFGAYFAGCVYVSSIDKVYVPAGVTLGKSAFDTLYGGREFRVRSVTDETVKPSTSAWEAFRLCDSWRPPIADGLCFRPERPSGQVVQLGSRKMVNTYVPERVRRVRGDVGPFFDFLTRLLPAERDRQILTSYMCALVQNPGAKFQWWPVLQGAEGNGKSAILRCLSYAVGERYTHLVNPEAMAKTGNQFNSWIQGNLFLGIEEIHMASRRDFLDSFKPVVTNDRIGIEGKGTPQDTGDNRLNGLLCTNHRDAIPVTVDSRRYAIFFTAQQSAAEIERDFPGAYFARFYEWLKADGYAIVAEYLHTAVPVVEFNPAGDCQRAPRTTSTAAALGESQGLIEAEIVEAIESEVPGFRGGIVSSSALAKLFDRLRVKINPKRYHEMMRSIGYDYHPDLPNGRCTARIGGEKPRLYFATGHPMLTETDGPTIAKAYEDAQGGADAAAGSNVVAFPARR